MPLEHTTGKVVAITSTRINETAAPVGGCVLAANRHVSSAITNVGARVYGDEHVVANGAQRHALQLGLVEQQEIGKAIANQLRFLPNQITTLAAIEIGRAHVSTTVTTAHTGCRLMLEKKNLPSHRTHL